MVTILPNYTLLESEKIILPYAISISPDIGVAPIPWVGDYDFYLFAPFSHVERVRFVLEGFNNLGALPEQ